MSTKREMLDTGSRYQNLANAIIAQAAEDWRRAEKRLRTSSSESVRKSAMREKEKCEKFFLSDYFEILTDLDGKWLLRRLKEEAEANIHLNDTPPDGKAGKEDA